MNSIVYHSNAYFDRFPNNNHGEFSCFIDSAKLSYIPKEPISIAVKSISFKLNQN